MRSFVRRTGRITPSQQRALDQLWPRYGVNAGESTLDFVKLFENDNPVILEIGFGNGRSLTQMALAQPHQNFIGIEVHKPGVGALLLQLESQAINNVRVISADAVSVLNNNISPESLRAVYLFFPDPWPKKRHRKRRIIQDEFVQLVRTRLMIEGKFHMATDWQDYAEHMLAVMDRASGFKNEAGPGCFALRPEHRPLTKFEARGKKLGHGVWDLIYTREY